MATIELRSGVWDAHELTMDRLPEREPDSRHVYWALKDSPGSVMRIKLKSADPIDLNATDILARHPDERDVALDDVVWTFCPVGRRPLGQAVPLDFVEPPHRVVFSSNTGANGTGALPAGVTLGEATDEELLRLMIEGRLGPT